jgi:ArsR family transcriptional regulator, arsenate/arsenite/antimonite-responsive transcriptional repressor / arsenate reductase (thioredoxin)
VGCSASEGAQRSERLIFFSGSSLDADRLFENSRSMDFDMTVRAFGALGHRARLQAFRELARAGADGIAAGELSRRLGIAPSSLSFHLHDLQAAHLARSTREGRTIRYAAAPEAMRALLWFLGEDCCQGRADLCASPLSRIEQRKNERSKQRTSPPLVLFLCTENSARSQMAEALLRHRGGDRIAARSAGLRPSRVHPLARAALAEIGVDTKGLRAKDLSELLGKESIACAIVLCPEADRMRTDVASFAPRVERWLLPDPAAVTGARSVRAAAFRATRDELSRRIDAWLARPLVASRAASVNRSKTSSR